MRVIDFIKGGGYSVCGMICDLVNDFIKGGVCVFGVIYSRVGDLGGWFYLGMISSLVGVLISGGGEDG